MTEDSEVSAELSCSPQHWTVNTLTPHHCHHHHRDQHHQCHQHDDDTQVCRSENINFLSQTRFDSKLDRDVMTNQYHNQHFFCLSKLTVT